MEPPLLEGRLAVTHGMLLTLIRDFKPFVMREVKKRPIAAQPHVSQLQIAGYHLTPFCVQATRI